MDVESRLQRIEAQVHQIKMLVWVVLSLVLALSLGLPQALDLPEHVGLILVALALIAIIYLLVMAASGLRQFWMSGRTDARLQERIFQEVIAERAKAQGQDPNP
jgi:antibiotic biosynthesis monooxygenase (ABM) superfamily enzyme